MAAFLAADVSLMAGQKWDNRIDAWLDDDAQWEVEYLGEIM